MSAGHKIEHVQVQGKGRETFIDGMRLRNVLRFDILQPCGEMPSRVLIELDAEEIVLRSLPVEDDDAGRG